MCRAAQQSHKERGSQGCTPHSSDRAEVGPDSGLKAPAHSHDASRPTPEGSDLPGLERGLQNPHISPHLGKTEVRAGPFQRNPRYANVLTVSLGAVGGEGCGHVLRAGFLFLNFSI